MCAVADGGLEIFGVAGKFEEIALNVVFVDGGGDEHVDGSRAEVGYGSFKRGKCGLSGFGG